MAIKVDGTVFMDDRRAAGGRVSEYVFNLSMIQPVHTDKNTKIPYLLAPGSGRYRLIKQKLFILEYMQMRCRARIWYISQLTENRHIQSSM